MSQIPMHQTAAASPLPDIRWDGVSLRRMPFRIAIAATLSVLLPGLGHLLVGERKKGFILLGITMASLLVAVAIIPHDPFAALAMFTQPRNLAAVFVADIAFLLFRCYAVIDVVRHSRVRSLRAPGVVIGLSLLLAITAAPHAAVAYYDLVTYQFLEEVFGDNAEPRPVVAPAQVELTREVRLADGVAPAAPPVVAPDGDSNASNNP
ncbi:MAG: hypothetical protein KF883_02665 [Thermomicrobiales bacterium]|nr:hypothetical protein [Thermomicrobiales bacterium]